ncbi:alpha/beta hydrolase [Aquihabitans sp. McL0605]|uniref:alpha/beta hydrolase n=1 Tax=Aquihabitans sp. McL0605 TaxID=3415671 RepID=UPI003CF856EF
MPSPPHLERTVLRRQGPQRRLLVLLHGYGESPADLSDRLDLIDPGGDFCAVVPDAPFERRSRAIWHRGTNAGIEAEEQFLVSLAALDALLGELEDELGLPSAEAVVGGFSQGGGLALGLLLGADVRRRPAAGFGICSFPPFVRGFRVDRAAAAGHPYFLSSARQDHFAPIESSRAGAALIRDSGLDLTYVESEGEHVMTDEAAGQVGLWLAALQRGERHPTDDLLAGTTGPHPTFDGRWEHVS